MHHRKKHYRAGPAESSSRSFASSSAKIALRKALNKTSEQHLARLPASGRQTIVAPQAFFLATTNPALRRYDKCREAVGCGTPSTATRWQTHNSPPRSRFRIRNRVWSEMPKDLLIGTGWFVFSYSLKRISHSRNRVIAGPDRDRQSGHRRARCRPTIAPGHRRCRSRRAAPRGWKRGSSGRDAR